MALIGAMTAQAPMSAYAQFGQAPMGQPQGLANGVVNNGLSRLAEINNAGPGFLYYGVNGADRGLGYIGSYMTVGGFIPYAQDDLGGFWSADLRGHLSVNGGFFSNVGVVRKQLLGNGSLLGVGVYWDYDGDLYQYAGQGNSSFGQFGHVYNQVGVSGEILTDWGDIRSNGYMPVGTTAYTAGAPGTPFYQNFVMCQYGLDAALGGADLEVGAYIPALADWAGMISVGGYALGNNFNKWQSGTAAGTGIVPWFGGVYTRLDMTLVNNWDFSLQYNNDSYFDSTGFARLTYRMGGSRRRNVPDQLEQPMMRNEHIVRAHQTPEVAINPSNGSPWQVFHVDNSAAAGGNGSVDAPFTTLAEADAAANTDWDVVFVHQGLSRSGTPYAGTFEFNKLNQSLIGDGADYFLPAVGCGPINLATYTGQLPLLTNPTGPSIRINENPNTGLGGGTGAGAEVANFDISGSATGIAAINGNLQSTARGSAIDNVSITGTAATQAGIVLASTDSTDGVSPDGDALDGLIRFTDTQITNATSFGILVDGNTNGTAPTFAAEFNGTVETASATNIIRIQNTSGGNIRLASGNAPAGSSVANAITATGGGGIELRDNTVTVTRIGNVSLSNTAGDSVAVLQSKDGKAVSGGTYISSDDGTGISHAAAGSAISITGFDSDPANRDIMNPTFSYTGAIANSRGATAASSYLASITDIGGGSQIVIDASTDNSLTDTGDGIYIENVGLSTLPAGRDNVFISGPTVIASSGANGLLINKSSGKLAFRGMSITGATGAGVSIVNAQTGLETSFADLSINLTQPAATGFRSSSTVASPYSIDVTGGGNSIVTNSSLQPAISIEYPGTSIGLPTLEMNFDKIQTGTSAVGPPDALVFGSTIVAGSTFTTTGSFTVNNGGTQGTELNNVDNLSGGTLTITLPP